VRLLIRVLNPLLYDIKVSERKFLVSFHYFKKMQPKQLPFSSITDYASNIYEKYAIHAIFLIHDMFLGEKIFLHGIYHALEDQYQHNIQASPVFAINVLMHVYCTRQVNILKERLIPRSFLEATDENIPLVMILIGEDVSKEYFNKIIDEIYEDFFIELLNVQDENLLDADEEISNIFESINGWITQDVMLPSNLANTDRAVKVLQSKMALFSLNLQLKS